MDYREKFKDSNDSIRERFSLIEERIGTIPFELDVDDKYKDYFKFVSEFITSVNVIVNEKLEGRDCLDLRTLQERNIKFYDDIVPENYGTSYANPQYSCRLFGKNLGKYLAFLYTDIRSIICFASECRLFEVCIYEELFVRIYNIFEEEKSPQPSRIKTELFWFNSDYSDVFTESLVREQYDPSMSFARDIILESDLSKIDYLYKYGEYISSNEIKIANFLNKLPEKTINLMADTMSEGYRKGFELAGKDLSKKRFVSIHYALGFERVIRRVIENFDNMGLTSLIFRAPIQSQSRNRISSVGFYSSSPNRQYDYDHKDDFSLYFDNNYIQRKLDLLSYAYEKYKDFMKDYAGPAVLEVFGETPFAPVDSPAALTLSDNRRKKRQIYISKSRNLLTKYVNYEERSFTIIAFPTPEIGFYFEDIFKEIIKINTLDYNLYKNVQQTIIDTLDKSEYVEIKGMEGNETNLRVALCKLKDPEKETKFENCVADVNIPVGEVFTSPKLRGTRGILHVSKVYLNNLLFKDLRIELKSGMITGATCANFEDEEKNKKYLADNLLFNHDTLPIGEFAIGTNTTAYVVAEKYRIGDKMPILIAEKMGPHFAMGDTCYSLNEDLPVYNPDGKEIICRDNEITRKYRKKDMAKAYFNCHTDITIPYRELGSITAFDKDGKGTLIISKGRFVLPGTEELNEPFEGQD
ncbi:MAG: leucyl aminopeptidase [Lachnospiraceae bacterium]|nr:leucyl aminopeptidase [Lachnospiraceae bacterium]